MKKRLFGILLSFALMLTMMPVLGLSLTAYADGTTYNPASEYHGYGNLITNDTEVTIREVSGKTWYVIAYDDASSTVTLLSKQSFENKAFNSEQSKGNDYETSDIKTYVDGLTGTGQPLAGISNVLSSDGQPTLIDKTTANDLSGTKRLLGNENWWLCSQGYGADHAAYVFGWDGYVDDDGDFVNNPKCVRPAIKLDLSKVMFNSSTNTFSIIEYPLWIDGNQVTSANADNILGDNTASYDDSTKTLTLNGATITKGYYYGPGTVYGIYYNGGENEPLIIESPSCSDNKIIKLESEGKFDTGIRSTNGADITFSGSGKLTIEGSNTGIFAPKVTIDGTDVTATSDTVAAISADEVLINSGIVTASGKGENSTGILAFGGVVTIKGGKVTASGEGQAIAGTVKNHIAGTGWTNVKGTEGKTAIEVKEEGQTLDEKIKKVQFPVMVTVKFDSAGGSAVAEQTITAGDKVKKPADPTRNGYTFDGWYLDSTAFDFSKPVEADIILTAHWKKVTQSTITYDLNGGTLDGKTGIVTTTVDNGTVITLPAPTRDGYTFDYWEGSKYNAGDQYTVNGDHTFKAVWKTGGGSSKKGVKTGDEQNVAGWITMMIASVLALAALAVKRKDILHR